MGFPDQPRDAHGRWTESLAAGAFQRKLAALNSYGALTFYHEAPGDISASVRERGLVATGTTGQVETTFATVNRPSGFVTSAVKTEVQFKIPKAVLAQEGTVMPDMRYYDSESEGPHQRLLGEHGGVQGADVSINRTIPRGWITSVRVIRR